MKESAVGFTGEKEPGESTFFAHDIGKTVEVLTLHGGFDKLFMLINYQATNVSLISLNISESKLAKRIHNGQEYSHLLLISQEIVNVWLIIPGKPQTLFTECARHLTE